jgi:hypothetical protein
VSLSFKCVFIVVLPLDVHEQPRRQIANSEAHRITEYIKLMWPTLILFVPYLEWYLNWFGPH